MAHGNTWEGKWRGNWQMEWVASTLHTTLELGVSTITTTDAHNSAASSRLNWHPRRFKWTRPFRWETKSGFRVCAITFQTQSKTLNLQAQHTWWHNLNLVKSLNCKDTLPGQLHRPTTTAQQMTNTSYTQQSISFLIAHGTLQWRVFQNLRYTHHKLDEESWIHSFLTLSILGTKKSTFLNIQLAHMHGRHGNIYRQTHKIMTAGGTVLILPCDMQFVTVQAAASCRYSDDVSLSIQFHSECANYININLGVHNFCYKNICTCKCEHTKIMCMFSRENLAHLRHAKCINACGDSNARHKT
jgi:hypothetical protein